MSNPRLPAADGSSRSEAQRAAARRNSQRWGNPEYRARHLAKLRRARSGAFGLTPRELEVVAAIVDGLSNIAIGERLGISKETVKRHLSNIFDKTGAESRLQLSTFAISNGIAPAPKLATGHEPPATASSEATL